MSEIPESPFWDAITSLAKVCDLLGGAALLVTFLLWFAGLSAPVLLVAGAIGVTLISVGIAGHVKMSREQRFLTLGTISPSTQRRKPRPQTNLRFAGIEHQTLYVDDHDTFWEVPRQAGATPSYCALLRFSNHPVAGRPGQRIRGLRARIVYRNPENGFEHAPVDRGAWVREEYNSFTLEVGDSRLLVVGWGFPPNVPRVPNIPTPWLAFIPINNHYSQENYGDIFFLKLSERNVEVDVQLLAGDGGYVMYEGRFNLQTDPFLLLTERGVAVEET